MPHTRRLNLAQSGVPWMRPSVANWSSSLLISLNATRNIWPSWKHLTMESRSNFRFLTLILLWEHFAIMLAMLIRFMERQYLLVSLHPCFSLSFSVFLCLSMSFCLNTFLSIPIDRWQYVCIHQNRTSWSLWTDYSMVSLFEPSLDNF